MDLKRGIIYMSTVAENRKIFLDALRSGEYKKGPFVKGQDEPPQEQVGSVPLGYRIPSF